MSIFVGSNFVKENLDKYIREDMKYWEHRVFHAVGHNQDDSVLTVGPGFALENNLSEGDIVILRPLGVTDTATPLKIHISEDNISAGMISLNLFKKFLFNIQTDEDIAEIFPLRQSSFSEMEQYIDNDLSKVYGEPGFMEESFRQMMENEEERRTSFNEIVSEKLRWTKLVDINNDPQKALDLIMFSDGIIPTTLQQEYISNFKISSYKCPCCGLRLYKTTFPDREHDIEISLSKYERDKIYISRIFTCPQCKLFLFSERTHKLNEIDYSYISEVDINDYEPLFKLFDMTAGRLDVQRNE